MANSKPATSKPRKRSSSSSSRSSNGSAASPKSSSSRSAKTSSRSKPATRAKPNASKPRSNSGSKPRPRSNHSAGATAVNRVGQVAGSAKEAVANAKGPAVAIGAAAAGVAGGLMLKGRTRRKTVLGVPVPRSLAKPSLSDIDVRAIVKSVGKASRRFGDTSRSVSKDIERAGDQAERIGKMLS